MAASLDDILGAIKNLGTAVANAASSYLGVNGVQIAEAITASTVIVQDVGRLASVSVIAGGTGSSGGTIYDTKTLGDTRFPIYTIPDPAGVYVVNLPFTRGLMVIPNSGANLAISYSTGVYANYAG